MLPNFIAKASVGRANCLLLNGSLVLEQFGDLRAYLVGAVGRDAASLLAEPVLTKKGDQLEVAWYAEQPGTPRPIDTLDAELQGSAIYKLKSRVQAMAHLLDGPSGALLARALYVLNSDSIIMVDQEPLLIQWGMLPDSVAPREQTSLDNHFAQTLGRYVALPAPSIGQRSFSTSQATPSFHPLPPLPDPIQYGAAAEKHRGLMIATGVAAATALLLALPNVLATPRHAGDKNGDALSDARKISKAMQEKVERARSALASANCDPQGQITVPEDKKGQLPPSPMPIRGAEGQNRGDMALVARRATESVVFVFTCTDRAVWDETHKDDKEKGTPLACPDVDSSSAPDATSPDRSNELYVLGSGSGFFVASKTIVTNFHVVEGAKAVFVTNRFIGRAKRVRVEATTPPGTDFTSPDFALLTVDIDKSPPPIELATVPTLLENVVAAGFPGVVIRSDAEREKLFHGDPTAVPGLTTFPGSVTLIKYPDQPMQLIYSSAVIGHGNSGGPLLDLCGRAIGMNTFGWSGIAEDTGYKINIAEGAKALSAFLVAHNVTHAAVAEACQVSVEAKVDKPPTDTPATPKDPPAPPSPPQQGKGK